MYKYEKKNCGGLARLCQNIRSVSLCAQNERRYQAAPGQRQTWLLRNGDGHWARGGASASAAAMTSLLWNVQTARRASCAPCDVCSSRMRRPARRARRRRRLWRASCTPCVVTAPRACTARSTAHYASHAKLLNLGQCSSLYKT
ncbi:hypothetical protein ISCGN_004878 [Ixodes scapularis]